MSVGQGDGDERYNLTSRLSSAISYFLGVCVCRVGTRNEFSSNAKAAAAAAASSSSPFHYALLPAASGCSIKFIVALSSEAARQHPAEVPFCIALV